jgi:flagellar biosynthetic protein FliQ
MTPADVGTVMQRALWTTLMVGGPIVGVSMIVGLTISIIQAATQINEATLTFVPKLLVVALVLVLLGPSMINSADRIHHLRLPGRVAGRAMTVQLSGGQTALLFLVMMRCTGLVFAAPLFGHHAIPTLVKFGLAAASRWPWPILPARRPVPCRC